MSRRAHGAEGIGRLAREHLIDREQRAAGGAHRRLVTARRHGGVGIDLHQSVFRRSIADLLDVIARMAQRDVVDRRGRRFGAHQRVKAFGGSARARLRATGPGVPDGRRA